MVRAPALPQALADSEGSIDTLEIVPAGDAQEQAIVPVFDLGASVAAAKLNLISSSCRHLVEYVSHQDAPRAIDGVLKSADDLSSHALDPALYQALVLANRHRKRQGVQDPVARALAPHLAKSPLKVVVGLHASAKIFSRMAQSIAHKLPEPPPAKYLLPPRPLDSQFASDLTYARYKLVKSFLSRVASSGTKPKQVIKADVFMCIVRSSYIVGCTTSTKFYHISAASDASGPEEASQELNEFGAVGELKHGIVSTVIKKLYEPYKTAYPDCEARGPFDTYTIGPAVSISSLELAASIAKRTDCVRFYLLKVRMIASDSLDMFEVCEAVETGTNNPIPTTSPSSMGSGGLLDMMRNAAHVDKSRRVDAPSPDTDHPKTKPDDATGTANHSDDLEKWLEELLNEHDLHSEVFAGDREDEVLEAQIDKFHEELAAGADEEGEVDDHIDIPEPAESWDDFLRRLRLAVQYVWWWVSGWGCGIERCETNNTIIHIK
jgi:hypothetical protein